MFAPGGKTPAVPDVADWIVNDLESLAEVIKADTFRVCVQFDDYDEETMSTLWNAFEEIPDCWFVVDEAHMFVPNNRASFPDGLERFLRHHRHKNQDITFVTQVAKDLWKGLRDCMHELYAFHLQEPQSCAYLDGWVPAETLQTLEKFEYVKWSIADNWQSSRGRVAK